jgi:hypothetical protein
LEPALQPASAKIIAPAKAIRNFVFIMQVNPARKNSKFKCRQEILSKNRRRIPIRMVLPHPCPLPLGEGELSADASKNRMTILVHGFSARMFGESSCLA